MCFRRRSAQTYGGSFRVCTFHHDAMNMKHQSFIAYYQYTTRHHTTAPPINIASPPSAIP